jgi:hypothetical protein
MDIDTESTFVPDEVRCVPFCRAGQIRGIAAFGFVSCSLCRRVARLPPARAFFRVAHFL